MSQLAQNGLGLEHLHLDAMDAMDAMDGDGWIPLGSHGRIEQPLGQGAEHRTEAGIGKSYGGDCGLPGLPFHLEFSWMS